MIQAIIFDFDGLILDTETPDYQAWQEVYQAYGLELDIEQWGSIVGGDGASSFEPIDDLDAKVGPIDREAIRARHRTRDQALIAAQPIMPGVVDYLKAAEARGLRLAIASSSPHSWVDRHLARLGLLDHFDAIVCRDDVERVKPAPDLFLAALAALDLLPDQAIVLEDSPNGVRAARRAGIFCVCVPNPVTRQLPLPETDLVLESLAALPLDELLARV